MSSPTIDEIAQHRAALAKEMRTVELTSVRDRIVFTETMLEYSMKSTWEWQGMVKKLYDYQKDLMYYYMGQEAKSPADLGGYVTQEDDAASVPTEDEDKDMPATESDEEDEVTFDPDGDENWAVTRCPQCKHEGPAQCACANLVGSEITSLIKKVDTVERVLREAQMIISGSKK